jgi:hypothetical protein
MNGELINEKGYINVTKLCKMAGKDIREWKKNKKNKLYIDLMSKELNININELIISQKGNSKNYTQGTWVHPLIATNIAQWISVIFSVKISMWIEEWKHNNIINNLKYKKAIVEVKNDNNNLDIEKQIQKRLQIELNGKIEVKTNIGYIDVVTKTEIIEIKIGENWKHGLGQLIAYGEYYNNHKKRLHLFNIKETSIINKICEKHNITVTYEL